MRNTMLRKTRFVMLGGLPGAATRLMLAVGLIAAGVAMAQTKVDTSGNFELDAQSTGGGLFTAAYSQANPDWDTTFGCSASGVGTCVPSAPAPKTFIHEGAKVNTFTGGGSKDGLPIAGWNWTNGSVPPKDDIQDGFAVPVTTGSGELLLYFGADRLANNGDANMGFWFFQDKVAPIGGGTFSGGHRQGDIFVVSAFTSGGQFSGISVYTWTCPGSPAIGTSCDSTGSLVLNTTHTTGQCITGTTGGNDACAISNIAAQDSPWPFTPKSAPANVFQAAMFFEGGINVSTLLGTVGGALPCFGSFMVETRSSQTLDAVLKDFVQGSFESCSGGLTKECPVSTLNAGGTAFVYQFGGQVHNTGAATLYNVTVQDTLPNDAANVKLGNGTTPGGGSAATCTGGTSTPVVCTFNLGTVAGGACVRWPDGESITCDATAPAGDFGTFESATNGGTLDTANMAASAVSGVTPTFPCSSGEVCAGPATATCPTESANPAISVTKGCTTSTNTSLNTTVSFSGTVCNQGNVNVTSLSGADVQYQVSDNSSLLNPAGTVTFAAGPGSGCNTTQTGGTSINLDACVLVGTNITCNLADNPCSCRTYSGSYTPSAVSGGTSACSYVFDDKVTATGTVPAVFGGTVSNFATAECHLCACTTGTTP